MPTLRGFSLISFAVLCCVARGLGGGSSVGELGINWPEVSKGVDSWLEIDSRELELAEKVQLPFLEGDRELLDYHEGTGLIAARTEDQQLILRAEDRASEIALGGDTKIYGTASFSMDGERLIGMGARASDYSGLVDCYDTRSGVLLWSRDISLVASKQFLAAGDLILVTNYHNQHREGTVAVQLYGATDGNLVDQIERVAYTGSSALSSIHSKDGKRVVYPSTDGILLVDTVEGELRWISEVARNESYLSADGRYLAVRPQLFRGPQKIIDLSGESGPIDISGFEGFNARWPSDFDFLFSEDNRSFYVSSEANGIERWDFLTGKRLAVFPLDPMILFHIVESEPRLFVLGNTWGGLANPEEDRIQFLEFNASTGDLLWEKSWDYISYSSNGSFGRTKVKSYLDMRLSSDAEFLELVFNRSRWKKELDGTEFIELGSDTPLRARAAVYLRSKGVFRVVWADGAVSDFDGDDLGETTHVWKNPLVAMGDRVMIDPTTGHVAIRILYDVLVFDAETGEQVYQVDEPDDIENVSDIRKGGTRVLLSKKVGEDSAHGVYDLVSNQYALRADQLDGYSSRSALSDTGDKLVVFVPAQFEPWRNFEMRVRDVDTAEVLAQLDGFTTNRAVAFSADEKRMVFATQYADGDDAARWALKEWDLQTGEVVEALDLTPLGEIAEPDEIVFAGSGDAVLVRSKFDCLYTVDLDSGRFSPIKYTRLGPILKNEDSLRDQAIAASPHSYANFDGRGRIELGFLRVDQGRPGKVQLTEGPFGLLEPEDELAGECRFIWSEDGNVWIDNEVPSATARLELEKLAGRYARAVWQAAPQ